jgi:hypothetical protein
MYLVHFIPILLMNGYGVVVVNLNCSFPQFFVGDLEIYAISDLVIYSCLLFAFIYIGFMSIKLLLN